MNFNGNFVLWCVLLLTKHCVLTEAGECVQRREGACRVLQLNPFAKIYLNDFHSLQPDGFLLKTSIEINLSENKHSYENNLPVERKRKIGYNLDNAAIVTIRISLDVSEYIEINLGKKYYRLAELEYYKHRKLIEKKYSSYTPILPTFPYNLHLEMTTNGTFSVYANTEPFFQYQLDKRPIVKIIKINALEGQTDLIAFVDCSEKHKPNCGSHGVDRLDGCREWFVEGNAGSIRDLKGFQKTYEKDVVFDEFVVVDIAYYSSKMWLHFSDNFILKIEFKDSSIKAEIYMLRDLYHILIKGAVTTNWTQIPASPYAVRIQLTNGTDNNRLTISNIRGDEILSLRLCEVKASLQEIEIFGPRLYLDCLHPDDEQSTIMNERPRKTSTKDDLGDLIYHENGYNFSKPFLDTRQFVNEPLVLYNHPFGNSTKDWCNGEDKPEQFVSSKGNDDTVQSVIKSSNEALLSELKEISADIKKAIVETNKAVADTNKAIADSNKGLLFELQSVKASIDAQATLERNTTTVNNYYNQLNVTEFLKLIKQN